jgi:chromosome partitioning protein
MFEQVTRLAQEITGDVEEFLAAVDDPQCPWHGAQVFPSRIRRNIRLAEAPSFGQTIFEYAPHSNGALDYRSLAEEVLGVVEPAADFDGDLTNLEESLAAISTGGRGV